MRSDRRVLFASLSVLTFLVLYMSTHHLSNDPVQATRDVLLHEVKSMRPRGITEDQIDMWRRKGTLAELAATNFSLQAVSKCLHSLTETELPGSTTPIPESKRSHGAQDGGSHSGKLLYCMGKAAAIHETAMYFLGYSCPGGVASEDEGCADR